MIGRANGVGPKLAARIANELQGKLGAPGLGGSAAAPRAGAASDALSALANLGFKPAEASAAVSAAQDELGADAGLDALVRLALRMAAKLQTMHQASNMSAALQVSRYPPGYLHVTDSWTNMPLHFAG
jgi:hypothetical protein